MSKNKNLGYIMRQEIYQQAKIGTSRHEAKKASSDGRHSDFIHGTGTLETTIQQVSQFAHYAREQGCKTMEDARQYADGTHTLPQ